MLTKQALAKLKNNPEYFLSNYYVKCKGNTKPSSDILEFVMGARAFKKFDGTLDYERTSRP